jgi:hypothetical protein
MRPPDKRKPRHANAAGLPESGSLGRRAEAKSSTARPYRVMVVALDRAAEWGRFTTLEEAERIAARLRVHAMDARVQHEAAP